MKKKRKCNVVNLHNKPKKKKRSSPTLPAHVRESDAGWLAIEWFTTPEENPDHYLMSRSECYEAHRKHCKEYGVKPLSSGRFSTLAMEFVTPFRGDDKKRWYRLEHVKVHGKESGEHGKVHEKRAA